MINMNQPRSGKILLIIILFTLSGISLNAKTNKPAKPPAVVFKTDAPGLENKFNAALTGLENNIITVYGYANPVLVEGAEYAGIWLECGPLEGAIYGIIDPRVAIDNHRIFFQQQHEDGYLPCWVRRDRIGSAQIQMVVPIAATAYEVFQMTGDSAFLAEAYQACVKWDSWLEKFRNTRKTGLCEAFCEYDTGHDNSPRWENLPKKCPEDNARLCPDAGTLPYLAPDLSATVYGGRLALAKMANVLGKPDAEKWLQKAEETRRALLALCFDPETLCFYDLDINNQFIRVRGDALTRVLCEHVVDQNLFELIYTQQIKNPRSFWTPYPLPSIAVDDPKFVRDIPRNSWGGASQALTALRAPRWFDHYGKSTDLVYMMGKWLQALVKSDGFRQQINPWTGEFTQAGNDYSPAMLVMLDYTQRLHGVRQSNDLLEWTCLLPEMASRSEFSLLTKMAKLELNIDQNAAHLLIAGQEIARVEGICRVITNRDGQIISIIGISPQPVSITITRPDQQALKIKLNPDMVYQP